MVSRAKKNVFPLSWAKWQRVWLGLAAVCVYCLFPETAGAYNPPVDSASGVTLRIEGPKEVTFSPEGFGGALVIENAADQPVVGNVVLRGIDGFQVEPAEWSNLTLGPNEKLRKEFRVTFGPRIFNAHYPLHVYGRFRMGTREISLHPILIFVVAGAPLSGTAQWEWQPVELREGVTLALDEWPIHRTIFHVFGQASETMPVGWRGSHPVHRGTCERSRIHLGGETRSVIAIHPPWFQGQVGTAAIEFPLTLPSNASMRMSFSLGLTPEGQSDGVTFRVRIAKGDAPEGELGQVIFERHTTAKTWETHEVDLTPFGGRTVRLQLESHPGPKNNTGWDSSYWGDVTIMASGAKTAAQEPGPGGGEVIRLGKVHGGTVAGWAEVRLGQRGLLDAALVMRFPEERVLEVQGFEVTVFGSRLDRPRSAVVLLGVDSHTEPMADGSSSLVVRHHFQSAAGPFDLVARIFLENGVLISEWDLANAPAPRPWIHVHLEDVALGSWSQPVKRVYAGAGNVIENPGPYTLGFDGHRLSTSFVGLEFDDRLSVVQGCDVPPTSFVVNPANRHYSLHVAHPCRISLIPAENVWEGAKKWRDVNGLKPSSGVSVLAGRFVFDLWSGRYRDSAEALQKAFQYGLTDSLVIWHNWQRWGYDYRLPEIFPPNPDLGTLEDMQHLAEVCRQSGVLFALHDNYIDFYPDAHGFSYLETIAFHSNGQPVRAWFNEGRQAQSYRYRADKVEPFLRGNLTQVAQAIKPTAYFIDVWSSIDPYDYWTANGQFFDKVYTRNTWRKHFEWIRTLLGNNAPQVSESGHDQLIGWLDGATTNHLRVGKPIPGYYQWSVWNWECADAGRVPWFDAAHHDRFILHGAGYSGRYQAGLDARLHGIYSDDYITTEVLTGHPAMVADPFGLDVVRKYWLLAPVGRALALDRIEDVEFVRGDIHRLHVRWESGIETWCNRGESDWEVHGHVLPQYGFLAKASETSKRASLFKEASIAKRGGLIVEFCQTSQSLYVNARKNCAGPSPIRPRATGFTQKGREIEVNVVWSSKAGVRPGWVPFAHFCDPTGAIVFQGRVIPGELAGLGEDVSTTIRAVIPESLPENLELELRIGLYRLRDGRRLALAGPDDGQSRIRLGKLHRGAEGSLVWAPIPDTPDLYLARQNPDGRKVNFGPVVTAQGVRISLEDRGILVLPLPVESEGTELTLFWSKLPWKLAQPVKVEYLDSGGNVLRMEQVINAEEVDVCVRPGEWGCRVTSW